MYCKMPTEYVEAFFDVCLHPALIFWRIYTSSYRFLAVYHDLQDALHAAMSTNQSPGCRLLAFRVCYAGPTDVNVGCLISYSCELFSTDQADAAIHK